MKWVLWPGLVFGLLAVVLVGLRAYGAHRWARTTRALALNLEAGRLDARQDGKSSPTHYHARELEGLPVPVQRYFRAALKDGQLIISAAKIDIAGVFDTSPTGEQWKPFTSTQRVVTHRPGFLWDAKISMLPGVTVRVVDSYIAGQGLLHAAIEGLFTTADMRGDGEIARGELMRWFAEVAWYPTALLPSQGVQWEAIDDRSARATIVDRDITLTLLFRFNDAGLIGSFRAEARGGMVGKTMVMAPWEGQWSNYQTHHGIQIPFSGEVAWIRPEGRRPYFVGTVTSLTFEFLQ